MTPLWALDSIQLEIQNIDKKTSTTQPGKTVQSGNTWQRWMQDISLQWLAPFSARQQIRLNLPRWYPNTDNKAFVQAQIICRQFTLQLPRIQCHQAVLQLSSYKNANTRIDTINASAKLSYNTNSGQLQLDFVSSDKNTLPVLQGKLLWKKKLTRLNISLHKLDSTRLLQWSRLFLPPDINAYIQQQITQLSTQINAQLQVQIHDQLIQKLTLTGHIDKMSLAATYKEREIASENFSTDFELELKQQPGRTFSNDHANKADNTIIALQLKNIKGAAYIQPWYMEFAGKEQFNTVLEITPQALNIDLAYLLLEQTARFTLSGLHYRFAQNQPDHYYFQVQISDLQRLQQRYGHHLLSGTDYENLQLSGQLNLVTGLKNNHRHLDLQLHHLTVQLADLLRIQQLDADINWRESPHYQNQSHIQWQQLRYQDLPIGASGFSFIARADQIQATTAINLPVFDSAIQIKNARINNLFTQPLIRFDTMLQDMPLQPVCHHFGWPQMRGNISAAIPDTRYQTGQLEFGGNILVQVFDGLITIDHLSLYQPLSNHSRLFANIDLQRLSLAPLTQTFGFGKINGRVSGYIKNLDMLNFSPQTFDFFVYSSKNDDIPHTISQKAVDNLSSMNGVSGLLSRGFLQVFENFSYDKLGIGCHLQNGQCRMRGVSPVADKPGAYYLVKGGGIPRIDIIGYEPVVDWQTLLSRLQAVRGQEIEDRGQRTEDRGQRIEDRG